MTTQRIARIAVPVPLRQYFDYLVFENSELSAGMRVRVPFGTREQVGVFIEWVEPSKAHSGELKAILQVIDNKPIISNSMLTLCLWAADYYHYPIGEVLAGAMPVLLRQGKPAMLSKELYWQLTNIGQAIDLTEIKGAARQIECLKLLAQYPQGVTKKQLQAQKIPLAVMRTLEKKGWAHARSELFGVLQSAGQLPMRLNQEQEHALNQINAATDMFQVLLLDGVTGSGKTEVYLQAIATVLDKQQQVLVLVPEIGLTPQTIQRFRDRFTVPVVALHSGLSEKERLNAWLAAKSGDAKIIIGTRSAIFTPFAKLGLIVIDEEHDLSFKQQDGFRYHARDLAIMRAHFEKIPVVLGSATPSLETLHNVNLGRYQHLRLLERAGCATLPQYHLLDICKAKLEEGLSSSLLSEMKSHLEQGNQVMLFLNRRGFAPILMCHACGWMAMCKRCDMRMTLHQHNKRLHCHHCDSQKSIFKKCEQCGETDLHAVGLGTQRLEEALKKYFPNFSVARIDRDSTQKKGAMEDLLEQIQRGQHQILIGTQMLAKGHHFPHVTLVGIVDADGGFFSGEFRALERMGQLLLQVAGRAGRVEKPGKVLIQTHHPDHPLLHQLLRESYHAFAQTLLEERRQSLLPPHQFFALFRAEAHDMRQANNFLQQVKALATQFSDVRLMGPVSAPMPRRAGRYRMQLLVQVNQRPVLQQFLKKILPAVEKIKLKSNVRWALDVDPLELF